MGTVDDNFDPNRDLIPEAGHTILTGTWRYGRILVYQALSTDPLNYKEKQNHTMNDICSVQCVDLDHIDT